jgi:hypothetical protein
VGFTEKDDTFDAFHPADQGGNAEEQYIHQIMFFTAVDPGVRDMGKFAPYVHVSLHPVPIGFFLEGFITRLPWGSWQ